MIGRSTIVILPRPTTANGTQQYRQQFAFNYSKGDTGEITMVTAWLFSFGVYVTLFARIETLLSCGSPYACLRSFALILVSFLMILLID